MYSTVKIKILTENNRMNYCSFMYFRKLVHWIFVTCQIFWLSFCTSIQPYCLVKSQKCSNGGRVMVFQTRVGMRLGALWTGSWSRSISVQTLFSSWCSLCPSPGHGLKALQLILILLKSLALESDYAGMTFLNWTSERSKIKIKFTKHGHTYTGTIRILVILSMWSQNILILKIWSWHYNLSIIWCGLSVNNPQWQASNQ